MGQIVYNSSQGAGNTGGSVVITKPASLAVGDALVAQIAAIANTDPSIATPTGWTLHRSDTVNGSISSNTRYLRVSIFSKVANSNDVAASNFTFTATGSSVGMCGRVNRLTLTRSVSPVDQSNGGTATFSTAFSTSGITPTGDTSTFLLFTAWADNNSGSVSGYAIANENPSWTEAYDSTYFDIGPSSSDVSISMAYGSRNTLTATGNATATLSASRVLLVTQIVNLLPEELVSFGASFSMNAPSFPLILDTPLSLTGNLAAESVEIIDNPWSNQSKNSSSWNNQDKS